ncbi:MAG: ATP-binding cassette domain-containing protein [Oscillospiraceae bacterium]|nr:ATP-binding cassette domain-containing protein [Oscillospiraceae bacterium]
MGWFDEQIRLRKRRDSEVFEDSLLEMSSAVLGKRISDALRDKRIVTKAAIDDILKYYHCRPVELPSSVTDPEEQLDYALRPHGIMRRTVTLQENWYRDTFVPMLGIRREDGLPVALLPEKYGGYYWLNAAGDRVSAGKATVSQLEEEAICFYKPLPQRALDIPDLMAYMKDCLNFYDYVAVILLTVMVTLAGMMLPRITKLLTGFVVESGSSVMLWSTAVFLLCVLISSQLLAASRELAMNRIQIKVALPMEAAMMSRLMSLPTHFFKNFNAGNLASRSGGINRLCLLLLGGVFSLGVTALASLLYINQLFLYAPALGGPAVVVIVLTAAVSILTGLVRMKEDRQLLRCTAEESGISFAIISGIQKIKLAGAEKRAFAKWARSYAAGSRIEYNPPFLLKISSALIMAIPLLGLAVIYYLATEAGVSPSSYLAFSAAYGAVTGAFGAFASITASAAQIGPILEMAEPILKAEPEMTAEKEIVTRLSGRIELSRVSFRYRENLPNIIDDLSLSIKAGEYVAIVGRTGCGKSTLMRLLLGFETPQKGEIYYDRKEIRSLDLQSLRRKMGVVIQNGSLFLGDIYSNITVSAPHLSMEDAWAAAETAGIAEDIRSMPMGMRTIIGEGQGGISGGQKQRIMIARAIAPKPKILIFDEATSALDNKTQKQVSQALDNLGCTRIVIAHRLSTIRNCDRILVLEGGRIIEEGTYDALLEKGGFFAELVERQRINA